MRLCMALLTVALLMAGTGSAVRGGDTRAAAASVPLSNVEGKKLIRGAREIRKQVVGPLADIRDPAGKAVFLRKVVVSLQNKGIDGVMFPIRNGQWWRIPPLTYDDVSATIEAFRSIEDWGQLTDNFLWTGSTLWVDSKSPDWFSDEDWASVCAGTRLAGRLCRECGFKGILLDWEQYGGRGRGVWKHPFFYRLYADEGYKDAGEETPKSFAEVSARVRQRGREYAEALTGAYPEIVLMVAPSLYEGTHRETLLETGGNVRDASGALVPAFVDGLLLGLDERASLVSACERTYCDSRYTDMLLARDDALRQALVMSTVPDVARRRITFTPAVWTDAGWGEDRFSTTDVRVNQRDPERHRHATHNALAAADRYAWLYGEMPFFLAEPTPLMEQYWRATREARRPTDLSWAPEPKWDLKDYSAHDRDMAARDAAFWTNAANEGWRVAVELPVHWRFRFDTDNQLRYRKVWHKSELDDSSWPLISVLRCWQGQRIPANGPAVYRTRFDAPADVDPGIREVRLAFGAYSPGLPGGGKGLTSWMDVCVNGKGYPMRPMIDVSEAIRPGQSNRVGIRVINRAGPAALMGHVKLLVREGK